MRDSFYTSTVLAEILVNYVGKRNISTVADFSVGGGELLRAAQSKWRNAQCYGTDISQQAISSLQILHPEWIVEICDFLDEESKGRCSILRNIKFDLILMNPPFTCKGSSINKIVLDDEIFNVSTAMLFLVHALKYINNNGVIFAILPISTAYSQKDRKIWDALVSNYNLLILEERDKQLFKNCTPNIILVSLNSSIEINTPLKEKKLQLDLQGISVFRGSISMHEIKECNIKGKPLIHSTNLRNNTIEGIKYNVNHPNSEVVGPAVLMQRVGNPSIQKICIISEGESYMLSDCVIAIKTKTQNDSFKLKNILFDNWQDISNLYKGTGAKYITIERLESYLGLQN